ncbi:MAG: serine protease [Dehalococcoidales bacterium]|nr:MAG: serine protease [Dehalococcoidales bacterium]
MSPLVIVGIISLIVLVLLKIYYIRDIIRTFRTLFRRSVTGSEGLVGKTAVVKTILSPRGTVFVEGENWTAVSEEGRVEPGEEVVVTKVGNLVLSVVKK